MEKIDNSWYVAIERFLGGNNRYYAFICAGGDSYRDYRELVVKNNGINIIAEQFKVSDDVLNKLNGLDKNGKKTLPNFLFQLIQRLNAGENIDAQQELSDLCNC